MQIKKDIRNELFKRQELELEIEAEKTPSFGEIKKRISEKFSKPEENIRVNKIKGSFGSSKFRVDAFIYNSAEELKKNIIKTRKQKREEKKQSQDTKEQQVQAQEAPEESA